MVRSPKRALGAAAAGAVVILAAVATLGAAGALSASPPPLTTVADGVSNPRGLELTSNGLYVAAAGKGGKTCKKGGPGGVICAGTTSKVFEVNLTTGTRKAIAKHLPSYAGANGAFAVGDDDVSVTPGGGVFGIETFERRPVLKVLPPKKRKLNGRLLHFTKKGKVERAGHISKFERKHDPDGQGFDSDPYGVFAASKNTQYVVDAAGNDVLRVHKGHIKLVAVLANIGANQAVPTSITRGPNGDLFVGEFIGETKPTIGHGRVIEINPSTGTQTVYARGLNRITGLSFDLAGTLFVTELTTSKLTAKSHGAVIEVPTSGPKCTVVGSSQLIFPAGGVVTADGATLYVSNFSVLPGATDPSGQFGGAHGQVVSLPVTGCR